MQPEDQPQTAVGDYSLPPIGKAFLDAVSTGESPAYNIRYNGGAGAAFSSYADHPRKMERITAGPYRGYFSDAAGRYQMTSKTWDKMASQIGLHDFSPDSQDLAAWRLANNSYSALTKGRDLSADIGGGDYQRVAKVMASEWASIGRNPSAFVKELSQRVGQVQQAQQQQSSASQLAEEQAERARLALRVYGYQGNGQ